MELQDRIDDLRAQGLGVAAISYDTEEVLAAFAERRGIEDVPLLSDDDSAVIRAFGIYNHVAEEGIGPNAEDPDVKADVNQYVSVFGANPMIVGTPFPGTFIVDREGRVTSRFFEEFYRERNTAANIMLKLGTPISGIAGSSGETAHLEISASQSNPDILVGSRFHLALDITPKPTMHVYAPGAEELGYRVIGLELEVPSFLRVLPAEYPASENLPLRAARRARPGLSAALPPGAGDRGGGRPGIGRPARGDRRADADRPPRLPGVRRRGLLQPGVGAAHLDADRLAARSPAGGRSATVRDRRYADTSGRGCSGRRRNPANPSSNSV